MTKHTFEEIKAKYPFLIYDYNDWFAMPKPCDPRWTCWLDDIPDGWEDLAIKFADKVLAIEKKYNCEGSFHISQMKEKFGNIRIYWCANSAMPKEARDEIRSAVVEAEIDSDATCYLCGKPSAYQSTGWIVPWCKDCVTKWYHDNNQEPPFGDDDELHKNFIETK